MIDKIDSYTGVNSENEGVEEHQKSITQKEITLALCKGEIIGRINNFLTGKGWLSSGSNFYKGKLKSDIDHREIIKPSKGLSVSDIQNKINTHFKETNLLNPLPILAKDLDTFFVVSGIQAISPILFKELPFDENRYIIHQPSIRLKFLGEISGVEGNGVSFINTNIFKVGCNFEEYLKKVDEIISMLGSMGIYAGNLTLELFEKKDNWNGRDLNIVGINFKFGNLEIGEAVYVYDFHQESRENIKFCDIGFGLERIMYARNNINNYFQQYDVDLDTYSEKEIEIIKTLVLMLSDNIQWESKTNGAGLRYKHLLKELDKDKNYFKLITCFYRYRSQFIDFPTNVELTTFNLLQDIDKYI